MNKFSSPFFRAFKPFSPSPCTSHGIGLTGSRIGCFHPIRETHCFMPEEPVKQEFRQS